MDIREFVMSIPEFKDIYDFLEINPKIIEEMKKISKSYSLKVFASKICQYCKIYIPNLLKIYDEISFEIDFVVWEDYTEEETFDLMDDYALTGLPTIIIYSGNGNKEVGRIVKEPHRSLEEDLLLILDKV